MPRLTVEKAKDGQRVRVTSGPFYVGQAGVIVGDSLDRYIYLRNPRSWRIPVRVLVRLDGLTGMEPFNVSRLSEE